MWTVYGVWGHERALGCVNVELHTFVMCREIVPSCSAIPSCAYSSLLVIPSSFLTWVTSCPSAFLSVTVTHFVSTTGICLHSLIRISVINYHHTKCCLKWHILILYYKIRDMARWSRRTARHGVLGSDVWKICCSALCVCVQNLTVSYPERRS